MDARNPQMKLETASRELRPRLLGMARRLFGQRPHLDPEDIVQDVLTAVTADSELAQRVEDVSAYLFRALRNRVTDLFRGKKQAASLDTPDADGMRPGDWVADPRASVADRFEEEELFAALEAALLTLPSADRELVRRVELGGETHEAIARETGEPLGTLLSRKHRAIRRLRAELEAMGVPSPFAH